ncbi:hypothetical protein BV133_473 [Blastochloris viridis]|uniref:Uncharacterized protein n=1 Tax=Blastochloris viridis TaxID=1079 RepID=A0A182CXX5_BLAVI|nr:hypothetical protein BV133_473 [Blastochloris viridis]
MRRRGCGRRSAGEEAPRRLAPSHPNRPADDAESTPPGAKAARRTASGSPEDGCRRTYRGCERDARRLARAGLHGSGPAPRHRPLPRTRPTIRAPNPG